MSTTRAILRSSCAAVAAAVFVTAAAARVRAEVLTVTSPEDHGGLGTLRWAVTEAEANGEADVIRFGLDPIEIHVQTSLPRVFSEIAVDGNGPERTRINISGVTGLGDGVFEVHAPGSLSLGDLSICNGQIRRAIRATGQLQITNCRFMNNHSNGGSVLLAQDSTGFALIRDSHFEANTAGGSGGVIGSDGAEVAIERSTFVDNYSDARGGAIAALWSQLSVRNCTFSENRAADSGRVLYVYGGTFATLENVTMMTSAADDQAGDILVWGPNTVQLERTIVSGGCFSRDGGRVTSLGNNLEGGDTCGLDPLLGDLIGVNPMLGPLKDNGGPTLTHALLEGSPAIDAAGSTCGLGRDQRGMPRPIDGNSDATSACDIGAVEYQRMIFYDGFTSGTSSEWARTRP